MKIGLVFFILMCFAFVLFCFEIQLGSVLAEPVLDEFRSTWKGRFRNKLNSAWYGCEYPCSALISFHKLISRSERELRSTLCKNSWQKVILSISQLNIFEIFPGLFVATDSMPG